MVVFDLLEIQGYVVSARRLLENASDSARMGEVGAFVNLDRINEARIAIAAACEQLDIALEPLFKLNIEDDDTEDDGDGGEPVLK